MDPLILALPIGFKARVGCPTCTSLHVMMIPGVIFGTAPTYLLHIFNRSVHCYGLMGCDCSLRETQT